MARKNIDVAHLEVAERLSDRDDLHVKVDEDVLIIVTQAFGPKGDNLVGLSDVEFDGYPAVSVLVQTEDQGEGLVHLSPFHGDRRKAGFTTIRPGTRCRLVCPVSKEPLDPVKASSNDGDANYYAIYLTPDLSKGELVALSDVWDDYQSRIVDNNELVSFWSAAQEA